MNNQNLNLSQIDYLEKYVEETYNYVLVKEKDNSNKLTEDYKVVLKDKIRFELFRNIGNKIIGSLSPEVQNKLITLLDRKPTFSEFMQFINKNSRINKAMFEKTAVSFKETFIKYFEEELDKQKIQK